MTRLILNSLLPSGRRAFVCVYGIEGKGAMSYVVAIAELHCGYGAYHSVVQPLVYALNVCVAARFRLAMTLVYAIPSFATEVQALALLDEFEAVCRSTVLTTLCR